MMGSMMRRAMIGDGSTLWIDFTTGVLDSRLTFTRAANTATVINSSGLVQTVNADLPRFDHDPTTQVPRGLLIEGTATNAALNSDVMRGTGWAVTNLVTPSNAVGVTDPANGTNSTNYIANGTAGYHFSGVVSTTTGASTTTITWSCWVKANGYTKVLMAEGNSGRGAVSFDIDPNNSTPPAPTVVGGAGSPTGTITRYPNNWYRISMRVGVASSTAYQWNVVGYPTGATLGNFGAQYTGDSTNGIYVWGAMLEDGSGASSYIPTGASTVTRNPDTAIIAAGTNFTSWYQGGTQGTFYADWFGGVRAGASGSTNRTVLSTDDVSTKHLHMMQTAAAGNLRVADFGGTNNVTTANTLTSGNRTKGAFSYNGSTANVCLNGGTVATGSSLAFSATPTWLVIGATSTNGTSITDANVVLNNCVREIKYWPTVLSNATLQSLTT